MDIVTGKKHSLKVQTSSKSDNQYTPDLIIGLALDCLGYIGLDPCSNSKSHPNVKANRLYTKEDNGLSLPWATETLYLNPPYSNTAKWVEKLIGEYSFGNVGEAILLVKSATDTKWYQSLYPYAFCLWNGRLTFKNPGNKGNPAPFASTLFYLGKNFERFEAVFSPYGRIYPAPAPRILKSPSFLGNDSTRNPSTDSVGVSSETNTLQK